MATPTVPMFDASRRAEVVGATQLPWQKQELIKVRDAAVVTRSHDAMKQKPPRARLTISTL
ncbi:hypothetical protein OHB53_43700 [Streptomyces sp. NBC_00056]|uniref:hypothetical protein n=1 Tax=unclassified Streptomyces TaxID=2593676 RepID=UPI002E37ED57|nr:hypothetical protein [Streptomyces sp. NBC_01280]WSE12570.1 hypothetical protein OG518_04190 [Streptomyces sp. NBC_01397]